jgi:prolyl 4-hydroxylase
VSDAIDRARQLLHRGDLHSAAAALKKAEAAGDALAARELAVWYLTGHAINRDLAACRSLFERAADLRDQVSARVVRAFVAGGIGGPADWPGALDLLRDAAPRDRQAAEEIALIDAMKLDANGAPSVAFDAEILSRSPEVSHFPAFFTGAECTYLSETAKPLLQSSVVVDPRTGQQVPNPIRTSTGATFPFIDENPAIHALNRRIAAASGTDVRAGEPLQVLRYLPGQEYRPHSDALPHVQPNEQRVLTFLVYLNDNYQGGETSFPALGLSFRGKAGDALMFRNANPDGTPDSRVLHAGEPVTRGVKFLASRWIRAVPVIL